MHVGRRRRERGVRGDRLEAVRVAGRVGRVEVVPDRDPVEAERLDPRATARAARRSIVCCRPVCTPKRTSTMLLPSDVRQRPRPRSAAGGRGRRGRAPAGTRSRRRPSANSWMRSTTSSGVPAGARWRAARRARGRSPSARRANSASSRPTHTTTRDGEVHRRGIAADRLARGAHVVAAFAEVARPGANGMLNSSAKRAARRGVRFVPQPPMMIGGRGCCTGFGSAGESTTGWCLPANVERARRPASSRAR